MAYRKLPVALKRKWLAALRSGEYTQGRGFLARATGEENEAGEPLHEFCCLGVLCDIVDPNGWSFCKPLSGGVSSFSKWRGEATMPPHGLVDFDAALLLADHNDGVSRSKWSFARIARWIEQNL